jgi:hypothetical protein
MATDFNTNYNSLTVTTAHIKSSFHSRTIYCQVTHSPPLLSLPCRAQLSTDWFTTSSQPLLQSSTFDWLVRHLFSASLAKLNFQLTGSPPLLSLPCRAQLSTDWFTTSSQPLLQSSTLNWLVRHLFSASLGELNFQMTGSPPLLSLHCRAQLSTDWFATSSHPPLQSSTLNWLVRHLFSASLAELNFQLTGSLPLLSLPCRAQLSNDWFAISSQPPLQSSTLNWLVRYLFSTSVAELNSQLTGSLPILNLRCRAQLSTDWFAISSQPLL